MAQIDWTPELIADLTRLWGEGRPASEIARTLKLTKNAVVGKAHRIGLPGRTNPIRRAYEATRKAIATKTAKALAKKAAEPVAIPRWHVGHDQCRFPHGDPREAGFHFCEERALVGRPYCARHYALCYLVGAAAERELKRMQIIAGNEKIGRASAHTILSSAA